MGVGNVVVEFTPLVTPTALPRAYGLKAGRSWRGKSQAISRLPARRG